MNRIYLIRHGQAGLRQNYDTLSPLGKRQATLLKDWFRREGIALNRVYSGSLARQVATARLGAGEPEVDLRLNEFDLDIVYRSLAPVLREADADFRSEYDAMLEAIQADDAPIHRQWNSCDVKVFQAWYAGSHPVEGESWQEFKSRALSALDLIRATADGEHVAIFTSGTPIGLLVSSVFDAEDGHAMRLAGSCYNCSVTTLRVRDGDVRLMGFNSIAHLADPALRSFR